MSAKVESCIPILQEMRRLLGKSKSSTYGNSQKLVELEFAEGPAHPKIRVLPQPPASLMLSLHAGNRPLGMWMLRF